MLEAAQVARRVSAPLRLAAMGLYGLLGAPTLAVESFSALDIKHIQHDTLSGTCLALAKHISSHDTAVIWLWVLSFALKLHRAGISG